MGLEPINALRERSEWRVPRAWHFGQQIIILFMGLDPEHRKVLSCSKPRSFLLWIHQRGFQDLNRFLTLVQRRHRIHIEIDSQPVPQLIGDELRINTGLSR